MRPALEDAAGGTITRAIGAAAGTRGGAGGGRQRAGALRNAATATAGSGAGAPADRRGSAPVVRVRGTGAGGGGAAVNTPICAVKLWVFQFRDPDARSFGVVGQLFAFFHKRFALCELFRAC